MYEQQREAIRSEMSGESAETQIEYRLDCIVRELDEMCALAANPETVDLIEQNKVAVGQVLTRAQLIASHLKLREEAPKLRIISQN